MATQQIIPENAGNEKKQVYVSPAAEVIEIKIEKGFAASPVGGDTFGNDSWGSGTW